MATIKQIDGRTIHQIQSGQVIVDLCSVVKELVENSIDAGASTIDVRFKNQGLDLIEVQDNGGGISPSNYDSIALKHYTSKLSTYADIGSLETFGFRGEALASLCALSAVIVTTCLPEDVPKGTKITFETSGKLASTSLVAAQKGTTVSIEKLFHNLPVRRRELERNIKREWQKVINLLNQYACISTNTKFSVSQQPTKGKRIVLFSTKNNPTTRENIINIFGAKAMAALVPLDLNLEMQPSTSGSALQPAVSQPLTTREVKVVGHVSRPVHGEGRQTPDRQMFFINGRPCGLPQFAKAFNEVYKSYNSTQSPFIFADIQLDTHMYDVNVSPDKRTILLHDQHQLLDSMRTSLVDVFESHEYSLPTSRLVTGRAKDTSRDGQASSIRSEFQAFNSSSGGESGLYATSSDEGSGPNETPTSQRASKPRPAASMGSITMPEHVDQTMDRWVSRRSVTKEPRQPKDTSFDDSFDQGTATTGYSEANQALARPECSRATEDEATEALDGSAQQMDDSGSSNDLPGASELRERLTDQAKIDDLPYRSPPYIPGAQHVQIAGQGGETLKERNSVKRAAKQAEIAIGDSEALVESSKRRKLSGFSAWANSPVDASSSSDEDQTEGLPSFGNALSQKFNADCLEDVPTAPPWVENAEVQRSSKSSSDSEPAFALRQEPSPTSRKHTRDESFRELDNRSQPGCDGDEYSSGEESKKPDGIHGSNLDVERAETRFLEHQATARAQSLQTNGKRKNTTLELVQELATDEACLLLQMGSWHDQMSQFGKVATSSPCVQDINAADAESKLSLIISKADFSKMRIAGQFNLGFIIAVRPGDSLGSKLGSDELFIIDQHASDEKYNFEKLQDTTVVQTQRLVHPKRLELTALEEEIVVQNVAAIEANGFKIDINMDGEFPVGSRCQLTSLPLSRETVFDARDLEELISLLSDESSESNNVPRPSKVRKMFAMRACRSSIMIGKSLTRNQMYNVLGHMGELDKPWNCPHGRPTMRHLCGLQGWDEVTHVDGEYGTSTVSWAAYAHGEQ